MKKILTFIMIFFSFMFCCYAEEKTSVSFSSCIDGDTAKFKMKNEIVKVRFLAINTPENTNEKEFYGNEASEYTCNILKNAKKIELEFDPNSDKLDKYDRYLAWIWVDDVLLQDLIISNGYGEIAYLYGDYKYTDLLKEKQNIAEKKNIGIWNNTETTNNTFTTFEIIYFIVGGIVIIVLCIYSTSFRKKTLKKLKKQLLN